MMNTRIAIYSGLFQTLPLTLWTVPQIRLDSDGSSARLMLSSTVDIIVLLQALTIALLLPPVVPKLHTRPALVNLLLMLAIPWPLLSLAWISGAVGLAELFSTQAAVLVLAGAVFTLSRFISAVSRSGFRHLGLSLIQLSAAGLVVYLGLTWLPGGGT
ncbi:MAG: hypothetical protein GY703_20970 [Gammaproteobacteria bacterium]|nr:hypothetical protein [Gammaproteobacteria bacterium]